MRDLDERCGQHDNPNSLRHQQDKEAKEERDKMQYEPRPALEREAGSKVVQGHFEAPTKGFVFLMQDGKAKRAENDVKAVRAAINLSKERRVYTRNRLRKGKDGQLHERKDYCTYDHGLQSLITTVAPWAQQTLARLPYPELETLLLLLMDVQAAKIKEISGRETFGGGVHLDTAIPHAHSWIERVDAEGNAHPKTLCKTAGPWTVGAYRLEAKFPGLLDSRKAQMLRENLAKKDIEHLVDIASAKAMDSALEAWIKRNGLWFQYEADCKAYAKRKKKVQAEDKYRKLMQAGMNHFHESGVWPLAYKSMKLCMWRMIPKELRTAITLSIRVTQFVRSPVRATIKLATRQILTPLKERGMSGPR